MDEFTATYSTLLKSELLGVDAVVSDGRLVHTRTYTCARAVTYSRALTRSRALGRLGEEKTAVWSPQRNLFRYQARPASTRRFGFGSARWMVCGPPRSPARRPVIRVASFGPARLRAEGLTLCAQV
jgi:hypothetical protein